MQNPVKITPWQFFFLAICISFGASMLTLPRKLAEIANEDMWMPVILGSILILIAFWMSVRLASYFPDKTILDYHPTLLGRFPGLILNTSLIVIMLLITAVFLRTFTTAVKIYLLDLTPPLIIVAIMLLPAMYGAQYGFAPIIRYLQFSFPPTFGLFAITIILGVLSIDTKEYQPFLGNGFFPVLKAIIPTWFVYTGPELLILFLYPCITKPQLILRYGFASIACLTVTYLVITLITQGVLGSEDCAHFLIPTVIAYRSVEIPDTFIERLDGYLMIIWIAMCYFAELCWIYLLSFAISKMLRLEYYRSIVPFLMPVLLYLIMLPPDTQTADVIGRVVNYASLAYAFGILPLLLFLAWRQAKRGPSC